MSAYLPYDSSLGAVPDTQGIGHAGPGHTGILHHLSCFGDCAASFEPWAGSGHGTILSKTSTIQA